MYCFLVSRHGEADHVKDELGLDTRMLHDTVRATPEHTAATSPPGKLLSTEVAVHRL